MKILFLVDGHSLRMGGAEIQAVNLAKRLQASGHEIEIVAPYLDRSTQQITEREGISLRQLDYWRLPKLSSLFYMLRFAWFLRKEGRNYDAIHIHMVHKMAAITGLLRCYTPCPVVAKISGSYELYEGQKSSKASFGSLQYWLYKSITTLDYFQTISHDTGKYLVRAGIAAEKIQSIPNGVDTELFTKSAALHSDSNNGKTIISFSGRLVPVKGLDTVIEAAEILQSTLAGQFEIHLYGEGPLKDTLKSQIQLANLENTVFLKGKSENVAQSLQDAHIYMQVSHYEGLSNAVLEAMASGLPLVLSAVGGNKDVVKQGRNGMLIPAQDPTALADSLATLITNRETCRAMGNCSRQLAEMKYSLESVTQRLLGLYNNESPTLDTGKIETHCNQGSH